MPPKHFDGEVEFMFPDGERHRARVSARFFQERWTGEIHLPEHDRTLDRGDVCWLHGGPFDAQRVVLTEVRGKRRLSFIGLITPEEPWETVD